MKKETWLRKPVKELLIKCQKVFNTYIRYRDADEYGFANCISCGKRIKLGTHDYQAGHFIPVSVSSLLRFDEYNVNGQCSQCNKYKEGNTANYEVGIADKYGDGIIEALKRQKDGTVEWDKEDLVDQIFYYQEATEEIKQIKGLE